MKILSLILTLTFKGADIDSNSTYILSNCQFISSRPANCLFCVRVPNKYPMFISSPGSGGGLLPWQYVYEFGGGPKSCHMIEN